MESKISQSLLGKEKKKEGGKEGKRQGREGRRKEGKREQNICLPGVGGGGGDKMDVH